MPFTRYQPSGATSDIIECYWTVENGSSEEKIEKIIPDGFPEIIFHLADAYSIRLKDEWHTQSNCLLAGQIKKYFYLKNTGATQVLGIKLKPAALTELFDLQMGAYTNKVVNLHDVFGNKLAELQKIASAEQSTYTKTEQIDNWFAALPVRPRQQVRDAINMILDSNGLATIQQLTSRLFITERQLERLFQNYIGLPPKFYARIIRFNYIFSLMHSSDSNWTSIALESGYYDSSHFTKNFKAFTGEDPTKYFFGEASMANFFLQKKSM